MQIEVQGIAFVLIATIAILDVKGSRGENYTKCMEYCSTFNADNSANIHRILLKGIGISGNYIIKHKEYIKA